MYNREFYQNKNVYEINKRNYNYFVLKINIINKVRF